jgi:hypothetical protein
MATRTRKAKKAETPEQVVARWVAGSAGSGAVNLDGLAAAGWEPGQVGAVELDGLRYEWFGLGGGLYVVIEWDDAGVCVL